MNNFIIEHLIAIAIWIPICISFEYLARKHKDYAYTYGIAAMGIMSVINAYIFR